MNTGGWNVWFDYKRQVWVAERYGVTMNHREKPRLIEMIWERVQMREQGLSYV